VLLVILVVAQRSAPRTEAWSVSGHQIITSRACRLFPGPWGDFFRYYESVLNDTAIYPDTFYRDQDPAESHRHFIDLEIWARDRPETGTLPSALESFGRDMSEAVRIGDWNRMLLDAGRLSHYLSDICQPYHSTVNYDPTAKNGSNLHVVLDSAIVNFLPDIILVSSVGPLKIVNFTDYAFFIAKQSHGFLAEINNALIDQGLSWSPRLTEIIENRTNTAIMATVNVWYTAVMNAAVGPPTLPQKNELRIVQTSMWQTMDLSHNNYLEFMVTDLLGVRTPCDVNVEVSGISLETESYQDPTDPWINYRTVLPGNKIKSAMEALEVTVTATREGYISGKLVFPVKTPEPSRDQHDYIVGVSVVSIMIMALSFVLLVREHRKQPPSVATTGTDGTCQHTFEDGVVLVGYCG
jgi:hypothetical protein